MSCIEGVAMRRGMKMMPQDKNRTVANGKCFNDGPLFYNMCISLSDITGPVFHDSDKKQCILPEKELHSEQLNETQFHLPSLMRITSGPHEEKECSIMLESEKGDISPQDSNGSSDTTLPTRDSINDTLSTVDTFGDTTGEEDSNVPQPQCLDKEVCGYYHCGLGHKKDLGHEDENINPTEPMSFRTVITLSGDNDIDIPGETDTIISMKTSNTFSNSYSTSPRSLTSISNSEKYKNKEINPEIQNHRKLRRYSTILRFSEGTTDTLYLSNLQSNKEQPSCDNCTAIQNNPISNQCYTSHVSNNQIIRSSNGPLPSYIHPCASNQIQKSLSFNNSNGVKNSSPVYNSLPNYYIDENASNVKKSHAKRKDGSDKDTNKSSKISSHKKPTVISIKNEDKLSSNTKNEPFSTDDSNLLLLLRKSSHTSDYSRSSRSSSTSTCSSCTAVCCCPHKTTHDSDYYGSSSDESKKYNSDDGSDIEEDGDDVLSPLGLLKLRYLGNPTNFKTTRRMQNFKAQYRGREPYRLNSTNGLRTFISCPEDVDDYKISTRSFLSLSIPHPCDQNNSTYSNSSCDTFNSESEVRCITRRHTHPSTSKVRLNNIYYFYKSINLIFYL